MRRSEHLEKDVIFPLSELNMYSCNYNIFANDFLHENIKFSRVTFGAWLHDLRLQQFFVKINNIELNKVKYPIYLECNIDKKDYCIVL